MLSYENRDIAILNQKFDSVNQNIRPATHKNSNGIKEAYSPKYRFSGVDITANGPL
jgi:hypothetical protein